MYFLKNYLPILKLGKKICIGIPQSDECIYFKYSNTNLKLLEELIKNGIDDNRITSNPIYNQLYKIKFLEDLQESNRNTLYYNYLKHPLSNYALNKRILIFGAGAAGGTLCYLLCQHGFKNIILIDDDTVEESDIQKTLIYNRADLLIEKTIALKNKIFNNYNISIEVINRKIIEYTDLYDVITNMKPDFVVKACDPDLRFRLNLNDVCFNYNIPFIYMSYTFERLNIGPLFEPQKTSSDRDIQKFIINKAGQDFAFDKVKKLFKEHTIHPSVSFNINILASIILKEIVFFFLEKKDFVISHGKEVYFFPLTLKSLYRKI